MRYWIIFTPHSLQVMPLRLIVAYPAIYLAPIGFGCLAATDYGLTNLVEFAEFVFEFVINAFFDVLIVSCYLLLRCCLSFQSSSIEIGFDAGPPIGLGCAFGFGSAFGASLVVSFNPHVDAASVAPMTQSHK